MTIGFLKLSKTSSRAPKLKIKTQDPNSVRRMISSYNNILLIYYLTAYITFRMFDITLQISLNFTTNFPP